MCARPGRDHFWVHSCKLLKDAPSGQVELWAHGVVSRSGAGFWPLPVPSPVCSMHAAQVSAVSQGTCRDTEPAPSCQSCGASAVPLDRWRERASELGRFQGRVVSRCRSRVQIRVKSRDGLHVKQSDPGGSHCRKGKEAQESLGRTCQV